MKHQLLDKDNNPIEDDGGIIRDGHRLRVQVVDSNNPALIDAIIRAEIDRRIQSFDASHHQPHSMMIDQNIEVQSILRHQARDRAMDQMWRHPRSGKITTPSLLDDEEVLRQQQINKRIKDDIKTVNANAGHKPASWSLPDQKQRSDELQDARDARLENRWKNAQQTFHDAVQPQALNDVVLPPEIPTYQPQTTDNEKALRIAKRDHRLSQAWRYPTQVNVIGFDGKADPELPQSKEEIEKEKARKKKQNAQPQEPKDHATLIAERDKRIENSWKAQVTISHKQV